MGQPWQGALSHALDAQGSCPAWALCQGAEPLGKLSRTGGSCRRVLRRTKDTWATRGRWRGAGTVRVRACGRGRRPSQLPVPAAGLCSVQSPGLCWRARWTQGRAVGHSSLQTAAGGALCEGLSEAKGTQKQQPHQGKWKGSDRAGPPVRGWGRGGGRGQWWWLGRWRGQEHCPQRGLMQFLLCPGSSSRASC